MRSALLVALAMATAGAALPAGDDLAVAWLRHGQVSTWTAPGLGVPARTPLGSTWKLFVYAYIVERGIEAPTYRCAAPRRSGEQYCCDPGGTVDRDEALARSCGLFFEPPRLDIEETAWRTFWGPRVRDEARWLLDLKRLAPGTELSVPEMLRALAAVPPAARASASRALLPVVIDGYGRGAVRHLGGTLRVKTFTWQHPRQRGADIGGGLGWLIDGTPVWFAAAGSSRTVFSRHAGVLASVLPEPLAVDGVEPCVDVDYFERYSIRSVDRLPSRDSAPTGALDGRYRVTFENGNALVFSAGGELRLDRADRSLRIRGHLPLSEYVARVVEREGDPTVTQAARALAVVARTWTVRNAAFARGCYQVADSTRMQRVSPSPPSTEARAAALFTDQLVIDGVDVRYHRDAPSPGVMAWTAAVAAARRGESYDAILASAFPRGSLAAVSGEKECRRLPAADAWLTGVATSWRRRLAGRPGFEPPDGLAVCALDYGTPYADRERLRIYVRGVATREDRLTIAHEYVHLAFRFHPSGSDEAFVERVARALVD